LHNEQFHKLYSSSDIIMIKSRGITRAEHVASMGEMRNAYNILVRKPEGKSPLGRHRSRLEHNVRKVNVKANLSLCLTDHHAVKMYGERMYIFTHS